MTLHIRIARTVIFPTAGLLTLTWIKDWLVFGDDLCKVRLFSLFAHLWHILFLHLHPLFLLGGSLLVGVIVCIHLFQQYDFW